MNRTPLKRGRNALRRRKRLPALSFKGERHKRAMARLRPVVFKRDGHRCQVRMSPDCTGRAEHAHHVWPRGRGGPDAEDNLISTCHACHRHVHDHPKDATERGFLRSSWKEAA